MNWCKALLAMAIMAAAPAMAQTYPDRPVRIVLGFAPGGGADLLIRAVAPALEKQLGQPIVIDYKTGAGGNLAMDAVAKARPDGYTLLMGTPGLATNGALYGSLPFDPAKDFAPIGMIGSVQNVLVVSTELPVATVREFVAYLKQRPGQANFATPGNGTSLHLAAELFKSLAGVDAVHVPYRGGGEALTSVVSAQTQFMFNVLPSALPMIKAGKVKALAVTGTARAAVLPEVPTMIEAGVPGFVASTWNGLLAPAGTPPMIVARLNDALVRALKTPEVTERLAALGQDPVTSTPEEFGAFIRDETVKWQKVISTAGLKAQ
jgi:tripartite-type tricarboxylate transporter receptor subunit TctC